MTTALPDNTSGDITPADIRGVIQDLIDSSVNRTDETGRTGRELMAAANAAAARLVLQLGDSATRNVGTSAGTVAAGDHGHSELVLGSLSLRYGASVYKLEITGVTSQGFPIVEWIKQ